MFKLGFKTICQKHVYKYAKNLYKQMFRGQTGLQITGRVENVRLRTKKTERDSLEVSDRLEDNISLCDCLQ